MNIQYLGEHLFPGQLGKTFIWIAFLTALFSMILYIYDTRKKSGGRSLLPVARGLFILHGISLIIVGSILYYIIFNHYFEYTYVWQYSSTDLPLKYIVSCFWAGQEGSFLIWAIFQAITGIILLSLEKRVENRVMPIVALSQVFMTSMLMGLTLFSSKIGGSPFELLRNTYSNVPGSIFEHPEYLKMIVNGNGLNPLLENIWMTIHPPVLFMGYALALIPFSYAIAALWKKDFTSWIRPAIPWTIISLILLGTGILLGGAWAYVSLTFGGFWAWDPVENSSLVPWMTLVASLHFLIISRKQRNALFSSFLFICLSYVLVLYASFLTRSGVLADTSAHSFGDNGMTSQLLIFLLTYIALTIGFIGANIKNLAGRNQEIVMSREFWMFIGSVIIILAAFQIVFTTSIPVFNSLFGTHIAPPTDPVAFYNKWQLPFVLLVAGFIAVTQFLQYFSTKGGEAFRKMIFPAIIAIVVLVPLYIFKVVTELKFILLVFFVLLAIVSSIFNLILGTSRPRNLPAILAHLGFMIFVLGTVLTFSNSRTISSNTSRFDLGNMKSNSENLLLMKGDTLYMGGFYVVYNDESTKGNETAYKVDFLKYSKGKYTNEFTLYPSVNRNPRMGDVYNPDTRHFLFVDYYTYISSVGKDPEYIVIKTIRNPYINVLWTGAILMTIGFIIAFYRRIKRMRQK